MYKIFSKILALRLRKVIGKVVGPEQSTYIESRIIVDGPLVLNELYTWAKKVKKNVLDFDKAFGTLN